MSEGRNVVAELNRIKVLFQARALATVMGLPPRSYTLTPYARLNQERDAT